MFSNEVRNKLENIIRGTVIQEHADTCTTIRNLLCGSFDTSPTVKAEFESKQRIKEEQKAFLQKIATSKNFWIESIPTDWKYLTKGGEAKVYLHSNKLSVVKTNDAIYYATWLEYFNSLVIHNLLFPSTAYSFLGFMLDDDTLFSVVKQPFIASEKIVELDAIREFLEFNGFRNKVRQDYVYEEYGLLLEDMHDENVILKDNSLFFIDTVFYVVKSEE